MKKHNDRTYANRVDVMIPHSEDEACTMYCTCGVPERSGLPCCDVLAALRCEEFCSVIMLAGGSRVVPPVLCAGGEHL